MSEDIEFIQLSIGNHYPNQGIISCADFIEYIKKMQRYFESKGHKNISIDFCGDEDGNGLGVLAFMAQEDPEIVRKRREKQKAEKEAFINRITNNKEKEYKRINKYLNKIKK